MNRMPPLQLLRAFDAAARTLSFTKAANELNVSQSAVSQQIRGLESYLDVRLFHRRARQLALTDEGKILATAARHAIESVSAAAIQIQDRTLSGELTISVLPSFGTQWLTPRLNDFRSTYPELNVMLLSSARLVDFRRDDIDVAIRLGMGHWHGTISSPLFHETLFPVCAPMLIAERQFRKPKHVLEAPLLFDSDRDHNHWGDWFQSLGIDAPVPRPWLSFESSIDMIRAATAGHGVALARSSLVMDELRDGRLIQPFAHKLPCSTQHYVVTSKARANLPKVEAFLAWLRQQPEVRPRSLMTTNL